MKEKDISTCLGKYRFPTRELAAGAIKSERLRRQRGHAYRCRICHAWHVGTQIGRHDRRPRPPEDKDDETGFA